LRRRIAGSSHVPDYIPALHGHSFGQPVRVALQMGVIVAEYAGAVELVNRDAPGFAEEELLDDAILHRNHRCSTRRQNIRRLMQFPSSAALGERVLDIASVQAANRQSQLTLSEQLVVVACPKIIGGNRTRECVQKDQETAERE
jgi:hypothetical protein